jgi:hypothetical protein
VLLLLARIPAQGLRSGARKVWLSRHHVGHAFGLSQHLGHAGDCAAQVVELGILLASAQVRGA